METFTEYRAVYRTPASIIALPEEREQGYVENTTFPHKRPELARRAALHRSEETLAWIVRIEERTVTASDWCTP